MAEEHNVVMQLAYLLQYGIFYFLHVTNFIEDLKKHLYEPLHPKFNYFLLPKCSTINIFSNYIIQKDPNGKEIYH